MRTHARFGTSLVAFGVAAVATAMALPPSADMIAASRPCSSFSKKSCGLSIGTSSAFGSMARSFFTK